MPKGLRPYRTSPLGIALTAWEIWRRIPKQHRRMIVRQARRQGPKVAAAVLAAQRRRRRARKGS